MTPPATRVAVVIVNFRTADLTIDCLRSLEPEVAVRGDVHVVVVDNGSADGSAGRIAAFVAQAGTGAWTTLVALEENLGYAGGNNVGIRRVVEPGAPDYVLLLNSDTLVHPRAIGELVDFMDAHPEVGIAGSRLENVDGSQQHSRFRFPSIWTELDSGLRLGVVTRLLRNRTVAPPLVNHAHAADWVAGASMIVRRKVLDDVGLLDEGYFLYFEDSDFCLAARRAGWSCWYVPASRVVHLVGRSSGVTTPRPQRPRLPPYWFAARQHYFVKNHGQLYALCADLAWTVGSLLWQVRRVVQGKPDTAPPHVVRDLLRHRFRPSWRGRPDAVRSRA